MKELIVFIAIIIMGFTSLSYHSDVNKMQLAKMASDNLAQETVLGVGIVKNRLVSYHSGKKEIINDAMNEYVKDSIKRGLLSGHLIGVVAHQQEDYEYSINDNNARLTVNFELVTKDFSIIPFVTSLKLRAKGEMISLLPDSP